jgi:hypothetical protein
MILDLSGPISDRVNELCALRKPADPLLWVLLCERLEPGLCPWLSSDETLILPRPKDPSVAQLMLTRFADLIISRRGRKAVASPADGKHLAGSSSMTSLGEHLQVDFASRSLARDGDTILLRRGEADLLLYLHEHRDKWLTTEKIRTRVFQREDPAGLTLVWKYASDLRRKLGRYRGVLQTSRTRGYRLEIAANSGATATE